MSNHVHLIFQPSENMPLNEVVRHIKGGSARKINLHRKSAGPVWSDKYFDRIIRNEDDFEKALRYIEYNPVVAGMTEDVWNYEGWEFIQS